MKVQLFLRFTDLETFVKPHTTKDLYEQAMAKKRKKAPPGQKLVSRRCARCDVKFRTPSLFIRTCKKCRRLEDYTAGEDDYSGP